MGFKSVQDVMKNGVRTSGRGASCDVVICTDKSHAKDADEPRYSLRIKISSRLLKEARYQKGDRVDVLLDTEEKKMLVRRVSNGGWALSFIGDSSAQVKFSWCAGLPSVAEASPCIDPKVTAEGIVFTLPENAVFDRNVRLDA